MIHPINESEKNRIRNLYLNHLKLEGSRYFYIDNPICRNIGGTLSEQVSPKKDNLIKSIQTIVDQSLIKLEKETEEMGLDEMEFINEIDSIEGVKVKDFYTEYKSKPAKRLHIDIYVQDSEYAWDNYSYTRYVIGNEIVKLIPGTKIFFTIKDTRTFGPGIDW